MVCLTPAVRLLGVSDGERSRQTRRVGAREGPVDRPLHPQEVASAGKKHEAHERHLGDPAGTGGDDHEQPARGRCHTVHIMSPNFYSFERTLRHLMADAGPANDLLNRLSGIPDARRPRLFKGRSRSDLSGWALRAKGFLAERFGDSSRFETDDVNVRGADLREMESGVTIEFKTGAVTHANVGLSTMTWALEDRTGRLGSIMGNSMLLRRKLATDGLWDDVRMSQEQTMKDLLALYGSAGLRVGSAPPPTLEHFARCVAHGITKMVDAKKLIGKPELAWNVPVILHADWRRGWKRVVQPFSPNRFVISDIALGPPNPSRPARVKLRILQPAAKRSVLFYPNYKNSFRRSGTKIEARHWVKTPCFHVWIDR